MIYHNKVHHTVFKVDGKELCKHGREFKHPFLEARGELHKYNVRWTLKTAEIWVISFFHSWSLIKVGLLIVPRSSERFNSARSSLTNMHDERLCLMWGRIRRMLISKWCCHMVILRKTTNLGGPQWRRKTIQNEAPLLRAWQQRGATGRVLLITEWYTQTELYCQHPRVLSLDPLFCSPLISVSLSPKTFVSQLFKALSGLYVMGSLNWEDILTWKICSCPKTTTKYAPFFFFRRWGKHLQKYRS